MTTEVKEETSLIDALRAFAEEQAAAPDDLDDPEADENAGLIAAGVAPEKIEAVREVLETLERVNLSSFLREGSAKALTLGTLTVGIMFAKKGLV